MRETIEGGRASTLRLNAMPKEREEREVGTRKGGLTRPWTNIVAGW